MKVLLILLVLTTSFPTYAFEQPDNAVISIEERVTDALAPGKDKKPLKTPIEGELTDYKNMKSTDESVLEVSGIAKSSNVLENTTRQVEFEEQVDYIPAQFRLDNLDNLTFPTGDDDVTLIVRCMIGVGRNGRISADHFYCLGGNEQTLRYENKVLRAMRRSQMTPAKIRGKRTNVAIKFSVIFDRKDGVQNTYFISNHLLNVEQFGSDYVAPQLIQHSTSRSPRCAFNYIVEVGVDIDGRVTDAEVQQGEGSERCKSSVAKNVKDWKFIPGFVNSKPTAMRHRIVIGWRVSKLYGR